MLEVTTQEQKGSSHLLSVQQAEIKGKADSIHSVHGVVLRHAHSKPRNKRTGSTTHTPGYTQEQGSVGCRLFHMGLG